MHADNSALIDVSSYPGRDAGPVVSIAGEVWQVRQQARGRAAELERAADAAAL
jgi:hypothetical protein